MTNFIISNELKRFLGYNQKKDISDEYDYENFIISLKKYYANIAILTNKEMINPDDKIKLLLRININSENNIKINVDEFVKKIIKYHIFHDNSKSDNLTYYIDKQIPNYITFFTL